MSATPLLARLQQLLPQMFKSEQLPGEPYIRFQLTPESEALLSMEWVRESLLVSNQQVTPIPNLPESFLGLLGSGERVFCLVDLAHLLKLPSSIFSSRHYQIIVIRVNNYSQDLGLSNSSINSELFLGLVVHRIQGTIRLQPEDLQPFVGEDSSNLAPYLQGYFVEQETRLLVLDPHAIAVTLSRTSIITN
jgi:positive phototaxis protein PixI